MTEIPYRELLKEGGCVRAALKATLQWGDWADVFCDGILSEMDKTHLEDFVLTYGAQAANVCPTGSGGVQLNIAWKDVDRGLSTSARALTMQSTRCGCKKRR